MRRILEYTAGYSMSRKGDCWDNASTESFFNSLKNELIHGNRYRTRADAKADVFQYIEVFYNRCRHSGRGRSYQSATCRTGCRSRAKRLRCHSLEGVKRGKAQTRTKRET